MKKYVLALLAVAMLMIPSVAYADVSEVAMVPVTDEDTSVVDTLSKEMFKAKNEALEKEFAKKHPELYEALKRTIDTPYAFNMNMNLIANIDYPETEEEQILDLRRIVAKMYMNGYINLPEEAMEMKMDIDIDAGEMMQESFNGLKIIMKDNMMYTFNPMYEMWDSESLESSDTFDATGNPMTQQSLGMVAPVADLMTKRETTNSTIYSLRMTGEDVQKVIDDYVGMPIYDELITEMKAAGVTFDIPKIETDYVIQDGLVRVQHAEISLNVTADDTTVKMVIAIDGEYYSYGLQKEILAPEMDPPVVEKEL
jgi:hypothetical protein